MGGREFLEFFLVKEENFTVGFEVTAVGGDSVTEGGFVGGTGAEGEGDGEAIAGLGNLGGVVAEAIPCQGRPYSIEVRLPGLSVVIFRRSSAKTKK